MTPFFDPGPIPYRAPPIWLGGVGPRMTEAAGEVADGLFIHPFCTQQSLIEITLPALERGRAHRLEGLEPVQTSLPVLIVTGASTQAFDAALEAMRAQVAFYASTPAYKVVLDVHGWGDLQPKLQDRTRAGDWAGMAALVPDDLLDAVAIVAPPDEVAGAIEERYGTLLDRIALNAPYSVDPEMWAEIVTDLQWSGDA
jgi:probable F420-dependent oxidoreductase